MSERFEKWECPVCRYEWVDMKYDAIVVPKLVCPVCHASGQTVFMVRSASPVKVQEPGSPAPSIDGEFYELFGGR